MKGAGRGGEPPPGPEPAMEYRRLGESGLVVSSIGLGTVLLGRHVDGASHTVQSDHPYELAALIREMAGRPD